MHPPGGGAGLTAARIGHLRHEAVDSDSTGPLRSLVAAPPTTRRRSNSYHLVQEHPRTDKQGPVARAPSRTSPRAPGCRPRLCRMWSTDLSGSPETRERVEQALVELDYVPNFSARGLRTAGPGWSPWPCRLATSYSAEVAHHFVVAARSRAGPCRSRRPGGSTASTSCCRGPGPPDRRPDPQPGLVGDVGDPTGVSRCLRSC